MDESVVRERITDILVVLSAIGAGSLDERLGANLPEDDPFSTLYEGINEVVERLVASNGRLASYQHELESRLQTIARQFQAQGIDFGAWLSATGQDPQQFMEGARPQAEQAVKADLALRAVAVAEGIEVTDDELEMEYSRLAMQFGQKARDIRRIYEQNDAVPELIAQIKKSKATDWLLHHVEMVDHDGKPIDRDLVLGHTHDDDDHDDHDHDDDDYDDHDHDDHDHDDEHDQEDDGVTAAGEDEE